MGTKLYKFTLTAYSYSARGVGTVTKPFTLILPEDDRRIEFFRCPAFSEEAVDGTGVKIAPVQPTRTTPVPQLKESTNEGAPIETIAGPTINRKVIVELKKAGYEYTGDVLDEENAVEVLSDLPKIGEKTAENIVTACRDKQ